MDTGPLCSKWNCGSEFSGDIRHLKDKGRGVGTEVHNGFYGDGDRYHVTNGDGKNKC